MLNLGDLTLYIKADTSDALGKIKSLGSSVSGALGTAAKVGTAAVAGAVTAATGAVVGLTKSAVEAYATYEQLTGGIETLFGTSADKVKDYADKAFATAQISANDYMSMATSFSASLLQSLGGDTEKAADYADRAIRDMSDNAAKMGSDISSIQNAYQGFAKQNYTMLDNLKLGYGGTKTEMERLIADASKLTDVQKQLGITVDESSLSFDNIVNAISVMQTQMGIAGTTAAEAMFTIEGTANATKAAWANVVTAIGRGEGLEEALQGLQSAIFGDGREGSGFLANIIPRIQTTMESIGKFIETAVPELLKTIPPLLEAIVPSLVTTALNLVQTIVSTAWEGLQTLLSGDTLPKLLNKLVEIGQSLLSKATEVLGNIINSLKSVDWSGIFEGLVTKVGEIKTKVKEAFDSINWSEILNKVTEFAGNFANKFAELGPKLVEKIGEMRTQSTTAFVELFDKIFQAVAQAIPNALTTISTAFSTLMSNLVPVVTNLLTGAVNTLLPTALEMVRNAVTAVGDVLTNPATWTALGNMLKTAIQSVIDLAIGFVTGIDWGTLIHDIFVTLGTVLHEALNTLFTGILPNIIPLIIDIGGQLISGLFEGMWAILTQLPEVLAGIFTGIVDGLKALFGIHSPSTVMAELGSNIIQGLIDGISSLIGSLTDLMNNAMTAIKDFAVDTWNNLKDGVVKIATNFVDNVSEKIESFKEGVTEKFETLKENVSEKVESLKEAATEKFETLKENVTNKVETLKENAINKFENLKTNVTSKVENLKSTVTSNFESLKSNVSSKVESLKSDVTSKFNTVKTNVTSAVSTLKTNAVNKFNDMKSTVSTVMTNIKTDVGDKWNAVVNHLKSINIKDAGKSVISSFKDGLTSAWTTVTSWASSAVESLKNSISSAVNWVKDKIDGSHRVGLNEVPYDGYIAELHRGERVLTAAETNQYQNLLRLMTNKQANSGNTVINFNGNYQFANQKDIDYFMSEAGMLIKRKVG